MKRILLASAALTAFAGAAAAEVTFTGDARLGYNDKEAYHTTTGARLDDNYGFYWRARLYAGLSQELDNGLTFGGKFRINGVASNSLGSSVTTSNLQLWLTAGDLGGLYFGDYEFSAVDAWKAAGAMFADGFSEQDGEYTLRGDINYGDVVVSVSTPVSANDVESPTNRTNDSVMGQWNLAASTTFGQFDVVFAYQGKGDDEYFAMWDHDNNPLTNDVYIHKVGDDLNENEIYALSVGTTYAGASMRLSYAYTNYADDFTIGGATSANGYSQSSLGLSASYPIGPVALSGWLVYEDGDISDFVDENVFYGVKVAYASNGFDISLDYGERLANNAGIGGRDARVVLEGGYKLDNGLALNAGYLSRDSWNIGSGEAYYVGGTYDLGSGAKLLVSYVDADETSNSYLDDDEVGKLEWQNGTTVEVSFKF
ncbi:putative porin [Ketogulonicigenium robustum]|uniref:Putative porin n=1 Tax=Ketogulonicigenium robustum TaxID=92947 RepID=A0A1W6P2T6_9RHOB|nr:porin [Ketogulonicigenium robustum]ARO15754.1 putative porin [Ketogulonicigenium robustum]